MTENTTLKCDACGKVRSDSDGYDHWLSLTEADDPYGTREDVCSPTCLIELAVRFERGASYSSGVRDGRHLAASERKHWWFR